VLVYFKGENMDKKTIIQEFVNFVEGRMSFEIFWQNYLTNKGYKKLLDDKKPNENTVYGKNDTINQSMSFHKWETAFGKLNAHNYIVRYLQYYNIACVPTTTYRENYKFRQAIQPSYISIEDEDYLNTIISTAPTDLSQTQQKKWLKERIKELFRYDKSPPRWIQDPEWPIINGKPLVFKGQTKDDPSDERVWYIFYDPDTLEETRIMQFY